MAVATFQGCLIKTGGLSLLSLITSEAESLNVHAETGVFLWVCRAVRVRVRPRSTLCLSPGGWGLYAACLVRWLSVCAGTALSELR